MVEFGLRKIKESFPDEESFRKFVRESLIKHRPKEEWSPKGVTDYIMQCRSASGIPMFRTGYGGEDFEVEGKKAVMAVCWAGTDPDSKLFINVPEEIHTRMKLRSGDWHFLMAEFRPDLYAEAKKYPVKIR
ncbi:MAG: hypothetical protein ACE5KD_00455 [Candidatus Bathyarchaeia archaeon]